MISKWKYSNKSWQKMLEVFDNFKALNETIKSHKMISVRRVQNNRVPTVPLPMLPSEAPHKVSPSPGSERSALTCKVCGTSSQGDEAGDICNLGVNGKHYNS